LENDHKKELDLSNYIEKFKQSNIDIQHLLKSQYEKLFSNDFLKENYTPPFVKNYEVLNNLFSKIDYSKIFSVPAYVEKISDNIINYQRSYFENIQPALEQARKAFDQLPPRLKEALLLLAENGWYLDLDMTLPYIWELQNVLLAGEISEVDNELSSYFEGQLNDIENNLVNLFGNRSNIIKSAFKAHRNEDYFLSIPVFLSQVDGICKEVFNEYFFIRKDKKPSTAKFVEQLAAETYQTALLSPLESITAINRSVSEREKESSHLNRHAVLHGESLDYGTKLNSLKSISLINYVSIVIKDNKA
jgi:hypothetical protein